MRKKIELDYELNSINENNIDTYKEKCWSEFCTIIFEALKDNEIIIHSANIIEMEKEVQVTEKGEKLLNIETEVGGEGKNKIEKIKVVNITAEITLANRKRLKKGCKNPYSANVEARHDPSITK